MAKRNRRKATDTQEHDMSANSHRRPVPARVAAMQELRRSNASGTHPDQRREASRNGCRGKGRRAALREQGWA